jgi:hypothetical protein
MHSPIRILTVSIFAFLGSVAFAAEKIPAPQAEVVARLVEIPGKLPANDLYNYVYIFKYKVLQVVSGQVAEKEILVGQYNPRSAREQVKDKMDPFVGGTLQAFKAGEVHRLKLVKPLELVWKDAIEDEYFDDTSARYFALQTDAEKK